MIMKCCKMLDGGQKDELARARRKSFLNLFSREGGHISIESFTSREFYASQ
jgi:hypothetical protein